MLTSISRFATATNMTGSRNPWRRYAAISWESLGPELNRSGFAGSVAIQTRQSLEETRWRLELGSDARTGTNLNPIAARSASTKNAACVWTDGSDSRSLCRKSLGGA